MNSFMILVIFLFTTQAFAEPKDSESTIIPEITPIPISVPIDAMIAGRQTSCNTDHECNISDLKPICGIKCWSGTTGEDSFEYTFKGIKFDIYGSLADRYHNFSVMLNGTEIDQVHCTITGSPIYFAKIYESRVYEYGSHTVRIQGIPGNAFEIHKITFWPSFQAVRLNVTDFHTEGTWTDESDKIGGIRSYTNNNGALKRAAFACSKVWVYGTYDPYHGMGSAEFAGHTESINQTVNTRQSLALIYESEKVPFNLYQLILKRTGSKAFSITCVYYLNDAPPQTQAPHPSRTRIPDSSNDYINKNFFETLPNGQILINSQSNVKQISGCHFININGSFNYFIRPEKSVDIFDNIFEYRDMINTYATPIYANYPSGSLTITNCRFINARCSKVVGGDGNVYSADVVITTKFDSCQFINCGNHADQFIFRHKNGASQLELYDCSFSFDDVTKSCKSVYSTSSGVKVNGCTFDKCGLNNINIQQSGSNGVFEFTNNIVQNCIERCILTNQLATRSIISGNIFQKVNLASGYFISIDHNQEEFSLFNNTFSEITTSGDDVAYGGGIAIWFPRSGKQKYTLNFEQCKFYDIKNNKGVGPYNNGGAIQYGYSSTISNVEMIFNGCEFKRNICQNGKGGAIAIDIDNNLQILNCIFEDNNANGYGGSIYVWGKISTTGDNFEASHMESLSISNCQFTKNKGEDGQVLYIEDEDLLNVLVDITYCTFINNGEDNTKYMIVNHCNNFAFEHNSVEYSDNSKSSGPLSLNNALSTTINNCTFKNSKDKGSIIFNQQSQESNTVMKKCEFTNCISTDTYNVVPQSGTCEFDSITISFDSDSNSCGGINFQDTSFSLNNSKFVKTNTRNGGVKVEQILNNNPISITGCTFDNCEGLNKRCLYLYMITETLTFKNNTIQNMKESGSSGYFLSLEFDAKIASLKLEEITFVDNRCNSLYGGGIGLWVKNAQVIEFIKCKFINNCALKSDTPRDKQKPPPPNDKYYSGDGGGIQYGFSNSIYDVNMIFNNCEFRGNKAVRHGGAIALQTVGTVEISNCIFENNVANYKEQNSKLLDYQNYYNSKTEGRGGAIYLNPAFAHENSDKTKHMQDVTISGCTFTSNDAYDGYAMYIEGDDPENSFVINGNTFVDNHDRTDKYKSLIVSEIQRLNNNDIVEKNTFSNENPDIVIPPLVIVDHEAQPLITFEPDTPTNNPNTPTNKPDTPTNNPPTQPTENTEKPVTPNPDAPSDDKWGDDDTFELINVTSKGRHEYIYTDPTTTYLIVVGISHFYNIRSTKDGGAIHITNAGITCNNTLFENCTSTLAGGGLYLKNEFDTSNVVALFHNNFTDCKAAYGGGIYVYSSNKKNKVHLLVEPGYCD